MDTLLLSIKDAARLVGIGRDTAYRLVESGEWPCVKIGKKKRHISREFLITRYNVAATQDAATDNTATVQQ